MIRVDSSFSAASSSPLVVCKGIISVRSEMREREDNTLSTLRLGILDRVIDVHAVGSQRV
jgi:hypothetical protein